MLRLLAILGMASGLRLITRSMIRTPGDRGLPVEYQPVPLRTKEEPSSMARSLEATSLPTSVYREVTVAPTSMDRGVTVAPTSEYQEVTTATYPEQETTQMVPRRKTTILRPVDGLWRDRQLMEPDIWGIIRTAYYCLFSGLDCFSHRVFPMVKSFIGYQPHYPYPRSLPLDGDRYQLMTSLTKELLLGLALVSLPWVGGVGLATGRALASGILGLAANANTYYM